MLRGMHQNMKDNVGINNEQKIRDLESVEQVSFSGAGRLYISPRLNIMANEPGHLLPSQRNE